MFIKRARARPSVRARQTEDDEPAAGSPLAQPISAEGSVAGDEEEEAGSVLNRVKAKKKGMKAGKGSKLSFGAEEEVS